MKFRVIDNKTGKEADTWNIALHEEWAQGLIYCDMEGFVITEDGYLMLADECGHVVYCDPERFKVLFEDERPHGEWLRKNNSNSWFECSVCKEVSDVVTVMREPTWKFCPNCGAEMRPKECDEKKSCLNCGTSECELGNRARYGFCGNWTMREGESK